MVHPDTFVKQTHKGLGLFAARDFKKGEILWLIDDFDIKLPLLSYQTLPPFEQQKFNTYSYLDAQQRAIIPWDEGKYINHSCAPNSTGLIEFDNLSIALRDIQAGEEIVEDYDCYFGHFETFTCQCGAPNCRGEVSQYQSYRADLRLSLADVFPEVQAQGKQVLLQHKNSENAPFLALLATLALEKA
jgi:hypothetical protein